MSTPNPRMPLRWARVRFGTVRTIWPGHACTETLLDPCPRYRCHGRVCVSQCNRCSSMPGCFSPSFCHHRKGSWGANLIKIILVAIIGTPWEKRNIAVVGLVTVCDGSDYLKERHHNFIFSGSCRYSAFKCLWEIPKRQPVLSLSAYDLHLQPVPSIFPTYSCFYVIFSNALLLALNLACNE